MCCCQIPKNSQVYSIVVSTHFTILDFLLFSIRALLMQLVHSNWYCIVCLLLSVNNISNANPQFQECCLYVNIAQNIIITYRQTIPIHSLDVQYHTKMSNKTYQAVVSILIVPPSITLYNQIPIPIWYQMSFAWHAFQTQVCTYIKFHIR